MDFNNRMKRGHCVWKTNVCWEEVQYLHLSLESIKSRSCKQSGSKTALKKDAYWGSRVWKRTLAFSLYVQKLKKAMLESVADMRGSFSGIINHYKRTDLELQQQEVMMWPGTGGRDGWGEGVMFDMFLKWSWRCRGTRLEWEGTIKQWKIQQMVDIVEFRSVKQCWTTRSYNMASYWFLFYSNI